MTEYTPTTEAIIFAYTENKYAAQGIDYGPAEEAVAREEVMKWLAAHDAEVRAGVVAEEPEREYGRLIGEVPYQWLLGSHGIQSATHWRTKAVPAGPWVPVKQEGADQ